jgi:hypothetical protein
MLENENSFRNAIQSIISDWKRLQFIDSSGATSKPAGQVRVQTTKGVSKAPRDHGGSLQDVERLTMTLATVIHHIVRQEEAPAQPGLALEGDQERADIKSYRRKIILENPDLSVRELALTLDYHEDSVRRIRREHKQEKRDVLLGNPKGDFS